MIHGKIVVVQTFTECVALFAIIDCSLRNRGVVFRKCLAPWTMDINHTQADRQLGMISANHCLGIGVTIFLK